MIKRLSPLLLAALLATTPALAANDKPLVTSAGKVRQIPAGDTLILPAPTTANASINLPHGTAPTTPANGDLWSTTGGFYGQVNGATVGPFGTGGGGGTPGGTSGQIQYNNAGSFGGFTLSGDCTVVVGTGAITCTKLNSASPGYFFSGTDAANLTGTVACVRLPALTGDVTTSAGSCSTTVANSTVTLAKIANASASSRLVGSGSSGSGSAYSELNLGAGLSMSGTTLNVTGGSGSMTGYEGGPPTPPNVGSFSWVNQSTSTASNGSRATIVTATTLGGSVLSLLVQSAPSAPFDVYLRGDMVAVLGTTLQFGLVLRNSSSGKFINLTIYNNTSTIGQRWNSATSSASNWYAGGTLAGPNAPRWLRFNVTSTTITGYLSTDGVDWVSIGTEALATFITSVDQVGISIGAQAGTNNVFVSYFSTTAPS